MIGIILSTHMKFRNRLKHTKISQGVVQVGLACRFGELCTAFILGRGGTKLVALLLAEASCTAVITAATSTCKRSRTIDSSKSKSDAPKSSMDCQASHGHNAEQGCCLLNQEAQKGQERRLTHGHSTCLHCSTRAEASLELLPKCKCT